jgi:hypothetical protein
MVRSSLQVVVSERDRMESIQNLYHNTRPSPETIQKAQDLSRELSNIDTGKLLKPFTI